MSPKKKKKRKRIKRVLSSSRIVKDYLTLNLQTEIFLTANTVIHFMHIHASITIGPEMLMCFPLSPRSSSSRPPSGGELDPAGRESVRAALWRHRQLGPPAFSRREHGLDASGLRGPVPEEEQQRVDRGECPCFCHLFLYSVYSLAAASNSPFFVSPFLWSLLPVTILFRWGFLWSISAHTCFHARALARQFLLSLLASTVLTLENNNKKSLHIRLNVNKQARGYLLPDTSCLLLVLIMMRQTSLHPLTHKNTHKHHP